MSRTTPLMISLSPADPRPLIKQITDGVRVAIASGELPVGAQLPSVRALAQQLTVNVNTIAKAYNELSAEGWLDARQGMGLFVAAPRQRYSEAERERRLEQAVQGFTADVIGLGYPLEQVMEQVERSLSPCLPRRQSA